MKRGKLTKTYSKDSKALKTFDGKIGDVAESAKGEGWSQITFNAGKKAEEVFQVKNGQLTEAKRGGNRAPAPRLVCIVTGHGRNTSLQYLQEKADRLGVDVPTLHANYISKTAMTQLNKGKSLAEVREEFASKNPEMELAVIDDATLAVARGINGKQKAPKKEEPAVAPAPAEEPAEMSVVNQLDAEIAAEINEEVNAEELEPEMV
tara:strand:+ start:4051 stop:4668 length:618 start_codon:yes stop_codon:yes gene_type:complete